ncbi:Maf family protein [Candidatus Uhrbacteria bacterium]|nr:Maf family protein [Candidatus Uhrbacteria bacterium]
MEIILGSSSPFRQRLLSEAGIKHTAMFPDIDEKRIGRGEDNPDKLTVLLAHAKTDALLKLDLPPCYLITSDQVVVSRGKIREKPASAKEARKRLEEYPLHPPTTVTAVLVTNTRTKSQIVEIDRAEVRFRPIAKKAVERAIARGTIMQCCGAFDLEDPDLKPYVAEIKGDRTSVIGLPIPIVKSMLRALGYKGR